MGRKRQMSGDPRKVESRQFRLRRSNIQISYDIVESNREDGFRQFGLILHDFPDSPRTWSTTMERLNPDFTFICPNLNISDKNINLVRVIQEIIREVCNEE